MTQIPGESPVVRHVETPRAKFDFFERQEISDEQLADTVREIEKIIANPDAYIDKGGAGSVYRMNNGWCVKVMEQRHDSPNAHLMKLGNTAQVEAAIQRRLASSTVDGVRVPWLFGIVMSKEPGGMTALLMEEIRGVNLQRVLNGEATLPDTFQAERFVDALESFIDGMHEEFGIAHGDLDPRNVMVDEITGMPRVIDFGRSVILTSVKVPSARLKIETEDLAKVERIGELLKERGSVDK